MQISKQPAMFGTTFQRGLRSASARLPRRLLAGALFAASGALYACSLLIPFDEYPGDGVSFDAAAGDGSDEASVDAGPIDASGDVDAGECVGIDKSNDSSNCGACGRRCIVGSCAEARCPIETVLTLEAGAGAIAALEVGSGDAGPLYLTATKGVFGTMDLPSGVPMFSAEGALGPMSLNGPNTTLAFAVDGGVSGFHVNDAGVGVRERLVHDRPGLSTVRAEGTSIFWGESAGIGYANAKPDAGVTLLDAEAPPVAFAAAVGVLYWITADGTVRSMSIKTPGNPATTVATGATGVSALGAAKKFLYLAQRSQGLLVYEATSSTYELRRKVALDDPGAVVTDGEHVYVIDFGGSKTKARLYRMNADGTTPVVLAENLNGTPGLAIDGAFVYFGDGARVARTSK